MIVNIDIHYDSLTPYGWNEVNKRDHQMFQNALLQDSDTPAVTPHLVNRFLGSDLNVHYLMQ